ncbi:MAG: DUF805 domain-containing protein [Acidimicrobiia bacterium]|nr:MAG: DUF805 domain-containing protein [Acidimicrobiia bacterium]
MENIDWQDLLLKFDGRINRAKFWIGIVAVWAITWLVFIIGGVVNSSIIWLLVFLVYLAAIWMGIAVSVKRWHDRGKSGWWVLIGLIPIVGPIWALIETGFLTGDSGDNQYGSDPLTPAAA